ncbi:glycoside hydrolase family 71/99-like protein [Ferruginibacter albus]|uniref:glycoside hydrolase family 71/99-like protein n=1 Tax=Ferruginibacter albus TaxID=2875540 RepID=UPI001CC4ED20|nr:glycoside hydrolase family 71/99-like protein [Ferruginibacter albus]UAY50849.1 hypothetical protein K9M53_09630 [Ferruginibacter albus]
MNSNRLITLITCILITGILYAQDTTNGYHYPTYKGLVMAGYQGWFNTPTDGAGRSWHHFQRRNVFAPGSCEIDLWPDMTEYQKQYPTDFKFSDGKTATVFSAYDKSTVDLHFKWMKDYGIDGVFMQRFVAEIRSASGKHHFNTVLENAMQAAKLNNRAICIMYDLSGMNPQDVSLVLNDIDELNKKYGLLNKDSIISPTYLHHNGRPLVTVWGVGFNDNRRYGFTEADKIIDGLNQRGYSVMLGVPTYWRDFGFDAIKSDSLHTLIKKCAIAAPWFVGRYEMKDYPKFHQHIVDDMKWCKDNNVDYVPLAFPGFSWRNMNGPNARTIDRENGNFFWQQVAGAKQANASMLYIAMFDEMNEGTSIFKCATKSNLPLNPKGVLVEIDDSLKSDYYLWLAGQAANWFHGDKKYSAIKPVRN